MRPLLRVLGFALAAAGCHNFDAGPQLCLANGVCRSDVENPDAGNRFEVLPQPASLTLGPGGVGLFTVTLARPRDSVALLVVSYGGAGADAGLSGAFERTSGYFTQTGFAVQVPLPFPAGSYPVRLAALDNGVEVAEATVSITVTPPAPTLLVDDDQSTGNVGNPFGPPSADDRFYRAALKGPVDTFTVPHRWDGGAGSPLALGQVAGYASIVWYTGASFGLTNNLTPSDRSTLLRWLDLDGKRLILVAQRAPADVPGGWTMATDPLLRDAIGAIGAALKTGGPSTVRNATTALSLRDNDPIRTDLALLNLSAGTQALMTATANPDDAGLREVPVASLRTQVGDAGTSTVAFIGFPLVNAADAGAAAAAFEAIRVLAGVP